MSAQHATFAWDTIALLSLLDEANKRTSDQGNLKIQKIVFLAEVAGQTQHLKAAHFRFFRWNLGPYSAALAEHVDKLEGSKVLTKGRKLTDKGKYILGYVDAALPADAPARRVLSILRNTGETYGGWTGAKLRSFVYQQTVPVIDFGNKLRKVEDIGFGFDIIDPAKDSTLQELAVLDEDLADEIKAEIGMNPSVLDKESDSFKKTISEALDRAERACS